MDSVSPPTNPPPFFALIIINESINWLEVFHPSTYDVNPCLIWIGPHHIRAKGQIRNCNILRCAICASYLPTNQPLLHPGPDPDPQNLPNHPHHHFPTQGKTTLRAAPLNGLKTHNPAAATLFCFHLKSSFAFNSKFSI